MVVFYGNGIGQVGAGPDCSELCPVCASGSLLVGFGGEEGDMKSQGSDLH